MFYQSESGPIYYEVHGSTDAPAVLCTHGGGLHSGMFDDQVSALKDAYQVITWDMQGHGRSAPLEDNLDVPRMADYLFDIMDIVGVDRAVLVGQSLGVYVNQHAAVNHPERVEALVHIGGLPIDTPMSKIELVGFKVLLAISRPLPERMILTRAAGEKTTTEQARQFFEQSLLQMGKEQFLWMLGGQLDACEIIVDEPPPQPLLIVHGEHEMPKSLIKANKEWHASTPGSRYFEVPDAGHNANMDNPEAFNQALLEFLAEI